MVRSSVYVTSELSLLALTTHEYDCLDHERRQFTAGEGETSFEELATRAKFIIQDSGVKPRNKGDGDISF